MTRTPMYRVMVFKGRRQEAFKDVILLILSRILAALARSSWTIAPHSASPNAHG
jgi:hypothetical protein